MEKSLLALMLVALAIVSCIPQEDVVKLGIITYLTGEDYTVAGHAFLRGAEIAVEEINGGGGLLGREVVLVVDDDPSGIVSKAIAPARKQVETDKVSASMIPGFGNAMAISGIFEQRKVPLFVLWDSNAELEKAGEYLFPIGPGVAQAGEKAARFLFFERGVKTVAIIKTNSAYSLDNARYFKEYYESFGGEVLFDEAADPSVADFRTLIAKAIAADPEGVYAPVEYHLDTFFRQMEEYGGSLPIHAGNAVTQQTIDLSKGAMEGVYFGSGVTPESEVALRLEEAYERKYGQPTNQLYFNALGYDAAMLFAEATRRAGTDDPSQIAAQIYTIDDFPSASRESISIGPEGSAPLAESVFEIRNGTPVLVQR